MKPSLPKGVRDFLPSQVEKRNYIFGIIQEVYKRYGYVPIETPTIESLSTLTGKYGEEGDRLVFKILNNGDYLAKSNLEALENKDSKKLTSSISKRGLRYDLTVPFARFVVMHQNDLHFPFKRYQIQPVWRADRPQKGRYNEFYQCDADVVGSDSLLYEAELMQIYDEVFAKLNLPVTIYINHRKILAGLVEKLSLIDDTTAVITIIDKLDKIGHEGVMKQFSEKGYSSDQMDVLNSYLNISSLEEVEELLGDTTARVGIDELTSVFNSLNNYTFKNIIKFNPQLARGLDYYTGCIFEVSDDKKEIGSLGGGGRYDNLTAVFGVNGLSGVGLSFGAERIYLLMEDRNLFPSFESESRKLIIMCDYEAGLIRSFNLLTELRQLGLPSVMYPSAAKLKKQFKYAEQIGARYAITLKESDDNKSKYTVKDLKERSEKRLSKDELVAYLTV